MSGLHFTSAIAVSVVVHSCLLNSTDVIRCLHSATTALEFCPLFLTTHHLAPPQVLPLGLQEQQKKRDRAAQIADHRRVTNAVDRCPLCFGSASRPRHLTISLGQTAYLALPARSDPVMCSLLFPCFVKHAFLCVSSTSVSCYLSCVFQACLSLAI